jgi:hypothetical protein
MWLHNDIILAKLQDGSITVLIEHFLHLLRSTGCHIILAESSSSWKTVQTHLCNPTHVSNPPSVSLNSILRDIEIAGYHLSSHTHFTITETDDNHFHLIPETSSSYPTESGTPDIIPTPDPIAFSGSVPLEQGTGHDTPTQLSDDLIFDPTHFLEFTS